MTLSADLDVSCCRPCHVCHGRRPAQHLLDGAGDQRRIVDQLPTLLRVVDEGQRAERDQVARRFVTRDQQEEGEIQQVFVGQLRPVDLGGGEHRQHVVARLGAPRGDQFLKVAEQLTDGDERILFDLGIGVSGARVRPSAEPLPVVGRGAEQFGDHPRRQGRGELFGELVGGPGADIIQDAVDDLADLRLENRHLPPGESGVDQLAELPMPRRIGEDQVSLLHRVRHHGIGNGDALGGGERVRVRRHVPDVFVLEQRPEFRDVVPAHRRSSAQLFVRGIRIADEEVGGMQRERCGHQGLLDTIVGQISGGCPMALVYSPRISLSIPLIDELMSDRCRPSVGPRAR